MIRIVIRVLRISEFGDVASATSVATAPIPETPLYTPTATAFALLGASVPVTVAVPGAGLNRVNICRYEVPLLMVAYKFIGVPPYEQVTVVAPTPYHTPTTISLLGTFATVTFPVIKAFELPPFILMLVS